MLGLSWKVSVLRIREWLKMFSYIGKREKIRILSF